MKKRKVEKEMDIENFVSSKLKNVGLSDKFESVNESTGYDSKNQQDYFI